MVKRDVLKTSSQNEPAAERLQWFDATLAILVWAKTDASLVFTKRLRLLQDRPARVVMSGAAHLCQCI